MFKKNKILHQKWDLVQYQNQVFFKCLYHLANQSQLRFISNITQSIYCLNVSFYGFQIVLFYFLLVHIILITN